MDHFLRIIAFLAVFGFASTSQAANIPLTPAQTAGIQASAAGWIASWNATAQASVSNAAVSSALKGNIAKATIEAPAVWHLAENAASVAMLAARTAPGAIMLGVTATWLASYGLEYIAGQIKKRTPTQPGGACTSDCYEWTAYSMNGVGFNGGSPQDAANKAIAYAASLYGAPWHFSLKGSAPNSFYICNSLDGGASCSSQSTIVRGSPRAPDPAQYRDATAEDWALAQQEAIAAAAAANKPNALPDDVANELRQKGVALPLKEPVVDRTPKGIKLSDPYWDPINKEWVADWATVTPRADGKSADAQITKKAVTSDGTPVNDPATNQPRADIEVKDMCEKNPDASGCQVLDEVEDKPLENRDINLSIIPLPGFGPSTASCPAPVSLGNKGGQAIQWEWTKFCDFSLGIRPLILGFAWIAAAMIVVGVSRKQGA